ncbi:MAG TPA: translocation/assembly module TamB domain-containing protein [Caulobacteraceae bacterium]
MSEAASDTPAPPKRPRRRRRPLRALGIGVAVLIALLAAAAATVRFGVLTPPGRRMVEAALDGVDVGAYGRLHVEGLGGDLFRDFTFRRLTISDAHGAWLDARNLRLRWNWPALLGRRLQVDEADAGLLTILRAPTPKAAKPGGASSLSVAVKRLALRLELLPAFSDRYGLYDVGGGFELRQRGGMAGHVNALSQTHAGDRLDAAFDLGRDKTIRLALDAREAQGGAMAGSFGMAADKPFLISASATGTTEQGRFFVTSHSGDIVPLEGQGSWSPAGGEAQGRMVLAASRLLAGYQHMLGPEAQFHITGARAADGYNAMSLTASSENVDLTASGEGDIAAQTVGPKGIAVTVLARDAQRLIGWPAMGAARFAGTLSGKLSRGAMAGRLSVEGPKALGYQLARVSGPAKLVWAPGGPTVQAALDGEGGAGNGLVAALLGGRPHAEAQLAWLDRGGILVKSLTLAGPGLKVTASGGRGLFGGLSFKGQASFSNFAAAHAGAKGLMTASWSAGQSGDQPWTFTFDAAAKDFATGIADLDRLVGASPALKGQANWDGHAFNFARADLTAAAGGASATGRLGGDGTLGLKLGWHAKGPVDVGPLEISGAASGVGDLTGTLSAPRADLAADFAAIDLPSLPLTAAHVKLSFLKGPADTNGVFALTAASPYGPARADTGFRFAGDGVDLTGLSVDAGGAHAAGAAALRRGAPSSADLTFSVGPGAFLSRGEASGHLTIAQAAGGARASLRLTAAGAMTREGGVLVEKASLTADGPLASLPYRLQASGFTSHGSWRADGAGALDGVAGAYGATFSGAGRLRDADFKTITPAVLKLGGREQSLTLAADVGGGRADVQARAAGGAIQARADLTGVGIGLLDQDIAGRFDAHLTLAGQGAKLGGALEARLSGAEERGLAGAQGIDGVVKANLAGGALTVDAQLGNPQGLQSHAHLVLPAVASAAPFRIALVRTAPMRGDFAADGEIKPLWTLLMGGERSLSGDVHASGTLAGTLADPQARGQAAISGGKFDDAATGLKLTNVSLAARLDQTTIDVSQLTGQDGAGGSVTGQGRLSLERAGASSFRLQLKRFRLIDNDVATAVASGEATISRSADGAVKLSGALAIDRADVAANPPTPSGVTPMDVVEINRQPGAGGGHLQAVSAHAPAVALDVTLKAPRGVFLKGRGLNMELSLDAHVGGDTAAPQLTGAAHVVRGDYDFAGKRFEFDTSGYVTLATSADDIRLDLTASREDPSLTALVRIEGTAARPRITLTSTPVLPSDEVLSQVLFGTSTSQLSPLDAATLASAASTMAGGAGFDVTANLRNFAHLDRLTLGGDTAGAIVSGGKYLTNNVYIELAGSPTGPRGAVEWRVQKNLSVVSRLAGGPGGDSQIEVRWRKDY